MFSTPADRRHAIWLSDPSFAAAEIARGLGYGAVILDIEHGSFDLADLERFIPFLRGLDMEVLAKVLGPERGPIQQALDFGATAVVIPHIENASHAKEVTAFAKFPPLGDRSFAGGRTTNYGGFTDDWVRRQDTFTRCYPMIEDAGAIENIADILALDTVDGVFVGPSDLSLRRERGAYTRTEGDFADLAIVAAAAAEAGKPWVLPAWSVEEKEFAVRHGADQMALIMQHGALAAGFAGPLDQITRIRESR
ncbi:MULTISPECIES: HpcH/HpaI aldolase family protein [Rhodococcus]|uniref:4-hydroxy-2-oxovalerate aldolase n=1 Tax=Rhodococcus erythropolis TaxID=1833 RepID=A0A0C2VR87_RHOER|nr:MULTISPECIES: aldolase/citrate lyase family protein [Rhodococcus]AGT91389.1 4-hydroxy-2-oxovalerate aldolase [Rhodococcus erythropolis CCM2595]AKD96684.1 4-hydroxy-2-oxovalerate aldolase [Rhodococcus erythropolis]ALU72280.1 4-hydroxy-2-oxovalerate aldolase [Rhodococcus erythropolis R138]KAB2586115.1 4-hydroxy-2-oxovalerate aldolase [Rhodococcus erythropolis]KIM17023.1 4-hydroxy-2-oxovalerate aldolase [Rhodococcus erythropolis]